MCAKVFFPVLPSVDAADIRFVPAERYIRESEKNNGVCPAPNSGLMLKIAVRELESVTAILWRSCGVI